MTNILVWIIFGALAGFLIDFIDKSTSLTWPERIGVGIIGAFVGGMIITLVTTGTFSLNGSNSFDIVSIVVAVGGGLVALFLYKRFRRRA